MVVARLLKGDQHGGGRLLSLRGSRGERAQALKVTASRSLHFLWQKWPLQFVSELILADGPTASEEWSWNWRGFLPDHHGSAAHENCSIATSKASHSFVSDILPKLLETAIN